MIDNMEGAVGIQIYFLSLCIFIALSQRAVGKLSNQTNAAHFHLPLPLTLPVYLYGGDCPPPTGDMETVSKDYEAVGRKFKELGNQVVFSSYKRKLVL